MKKENVLLLLVALVLMATTAFGAALLDPNDAIIAIDEDGGMVVSNSSYPGAESPPNALDGDSGTKYLNFGGPGSGIIVTPAFAIAVQSFTLTTANDAAGRDPSTWELYGTDDPITSVDNSSGTAENWTLIDSGDLDLPEERLTLAAPVDVNNMVAYTSLKLVFPLLSGDNLFQIADIAFYSLPGALGPNLLSAADPVIGIQEGFVWDSSYPGAENPGGAIDGTADTKYLNFGEELSGFIVTPAVGPTMLDGFDVTTANDAVERDPVVWMIYGTNDEIVSEDNSGGDAENWTLICGGTMALPDERFTLGPLYTIANQAEPYTSYKVVFETVKDAAAANSMQIAEFQLYGEVAEIVQP